MSTRRHAMASISGFSQVPNGGEPQRIESAFVAKTYVQTLPSSFEVKESGKVSLAKSISWLPTTPSESEALKDQTVFQGAMLAFAYINQKLQGR
jgi:hypothetical protein